MKQFDEIRTEKRIQVKEKGTDGFNGFLTLKGQVLYFVASWGGGWDHVSVSLRNRCPTWDEMCQVKDIFFSPDECCIEYHPARKDYVNVYPFCLHIWRPQETEIPKPPRYFV